MPDAGTAIYGKLSATAGVTALVGTRIYPHRQPQHARTYPFIVYRAGEDDYGDFYTGTTNPARNAIDIAIIGESYDSVIDVYAAMKTAIHNGTGTWGGVVVKGCFEESTFEDLTIPDGTDRRLFVRETSFTLWFNV